jgi:hypothetical protein
MEDKPTAAFALSLVGAIFIIIGGVVTMAVTSFLGGVMTLIPGFEGLGTMLIVLGLIGLVWGIITLVGAIMINSGEPSKVKTGSILVLIFSILSWFGAYGGLFIGFLLGLIGAILGLTWKPERKTTAPPPPP